jgi:undecaprenyl-diphosphatase
MLLLIAAILGLVEGFTEFLPISSTGHLILAGSLLGFTGDKAKVFEIVIQTGAIFAIIGMYAARLGSMAVSVVGGSAPHRVKSRRLVLNILIGFLPAVVLGLLFGKAVKAHLFTPVVVASTFILGGLVILWVEKRPGRGKTSAARVQDVEDLSAFDALKVGLVQCLALIPGTSRSGATIIGGMLLGLSRKAATEFSFFLAIPTLLGAGAYSLYKERALLSWSDLPLFAVGLLVSFASAWVCVRWLLRYVATHNFIPFAWYRILFGILVLVTAWAGVVHWAE